MEACSKIIKKQLWARERIHYSSEGRIEKSVIDLFSIQRVKQACAALRLDSTSKVCLNGFIHMQAA